VEAYTKRSLAGDEEMQLVRKYSTLASLYLRSTFVQVFSDEFNTEGRSFYPGQCADMIYAGDSVEKP
jgi:hypothetical protein